MFVILLSNPVSWAFCSSFQALDLNKSPLQSRNLGMTRTMCVSPLPAKMSSLLPFGSRSKGGCKTRYYHVTHILGIL